MKKAYKFGLEVEFGVPDNTSGADLENSLNKIGNDLKSDGSLHFDDGFEAYETTTAPLGYNAMQRTIVKMGKVFRKYDATANKTCGVHIHCSNKRFFKVKYLKKIIAFWLSIEDVLFSTQPESRLNSDYCKRLLGRFVNGRIPEKLSTTKDRLIGECRSIDRYCAFNLNSLGNGSNGHGTLEIRLFAGNTNPSNLLAYLELTRAIYDYALTSYKSDEVHNLFKMGISDDKVNKVFELLKLSEKTKTLLLTRIRKNLFETLKRQQEGAVKYQEIQPKIKSVRKRYEVAQRSYETAMSDVRAVTRLFRPEY